jgi:hypothetical protein
VNVNLSLTNYYNMKSEPIFMLLAFLFAYTSCSTDENPLLITKAGELTITEFQLGNLDLFRVEGTVTEDFTFTNNRVWVLEGGVFVADGATLTVEPGTKVYGSFNAGTSFLSVQRGGKLYAEGTAENPIFFSTLRQVTSIPQPGDWGGIIINGKAPVNTVTGEAEGEGGTGTYGGSIPTDDSGVLRYVIIEYAGKLLGVENELNSLSLNGVGNETTIEYVECLYGKDDGIEIFGGTVNLRYILSLGNADDAFDWTYGWSGKGQFWIAQQDTFEGDKAIEADNNDVNVVASPFSNPTISNITLVGAQDADDGNSGIQLRRGTKGKLYNTLVTGFSRHGVEVDNASAVHIGTGELIVANSIVFSNAKKSSSGANFKNADAFASDITNKTVNPNVLSGFKGVVATGALDPSTIDPWFTSVSFIGALDPQNDWATTWVNVLR